MNSNAAVRVQAVLARHIDEPGALLPLLHDVQGALGYIPPESVAAIADALNLSRAEVHGVISYYHDFHTEPPPARHLRICRAEACQAMGAEALLEHARQHLASEDLAVDAVYCLGLCATSPALMLDGEVHARMTPEKLAALVGER